MKGFSEHAPTSYHGLGVRIYMEPGSVHDLSHVLVKRQLDEVMASWSRVQQTMRELKLAWAGEGANGAQDIHDRLTAAHADMFGLADPSGDGKSGILDLLRIGAVRASVNFGEIELKVAEMCDRFADGLEATGGTGGPKSDPGGPVAITYTKV